MSDTAFVQVLDLAAGVALVAAYVVLWRRGLVAIVQALAVQGAAVATIAFAVGIHHHDPELMGVAVLVAVLKVGVIPAVLVRVVRDSAEARETEPLVNVTASLVSGAVLTLVAYATTRQLVALSPAPETRAIPIGIAIVLLGFFVLATRQKAVTQIVGFLLVDNGIAVVAFLATAGVPLVVEAGAALDLLLAVLILQVFTARMRTKFGALDLDRLRELHD